MLLTKNAMAWMALLSRFVLFVVFQSEPRCMLRKQSIYTTELHPRPLFLVLKKTKIVQRKWTLTGEKHDTGGWRFLRDFLPFQPVMLQKPGPALLCMNTQFKFKDRTFCLAKKITKRNRGVLAQLPPIYFAKIIGWKVHWVKNFQNLPNTYPIPLSLLVPSNYNTKQACCTTAVAVIACGPNQSP